MDDSIRNLMYELDGPWRNDSCLGYAEMAMWAVGLDGETIGRVLSQMQRCFDEESTESAADYYIGLWR